MLVPMIFALALQDRMSDKLVSTDQLLEPAGRQIVLSSRPVDIAVSPNGEYVIVKQNKGVTVLRASDWSVASEANVKSGASMHGLLCTNNREVFFSDAHSTVHEGKLDAGGRIDWTREIEMPKPKIGGEAYPCGLAVLADGSLAVCASRSNALVLAKGESLTSIDLDPCPFGIALEGDGKTAWVTCWGRKPGRHHSNSAGTEVDVDDRGIATGGQVDVVDLAAGKVLARLPAAQQPSQIAIDRGIAYVANANNDTVGIYDTAKRRLLRQVVVKPDPKLPFGSAPNALAVSPATNELFVACGGNNAVAVMTLGTSPQIKGWIPAGWYPGAVTVSHGNLYVASIKGTGSRSGPADKRSVYEFSGTVAQLPVPAGDDLAQMTATSKRLVQAPSILQSFVRTNLVSDTPQPVPANLGAPSPIEHIVYIVKENRTYDQVLGDIGKGESDPKLTIYGADVTPNEHALANQFCLLDNFYCNGVNSADGHSWLTEAIASSYLERSFGGFTRSYPFGGDDALNSAYSGFIWDAVLGSGRSFRNYGEGDYAGLTKMMSWKQIYDAALAGNSLKFKQNIANERLRRYSCPDFPGWNLTISDQYRANVFLKELAQFERKGAMPNLSIVYLEQDHTAGMVAGMPTPKAMVADNDYALGRVIDGISHSKFWPRTAVFVIEDDAQNGFDHVDGHRSTCFVVSPYSQTGRVVSNFYNQTGLVHTMLQILGVPPLNQMDAIAPLMTECFTETPNLTPFTAKANVIPLDQLTTTRRASTLQLKWIAKSAKLDFSGPDEADEDVLNHAQWVSAKGAKPYPRPGTARE